ncbi:aspartate carbamoyltransferase catalytic subunit [Virgibacillus sp. YIM 98842]|uniref:aspartate carbamoyltransferase catalytic subunit n=1 Tax=Virgibacillus sp. YIM 98842 TaxID=2663533 RepID=UPI0013DBB0B7|nr:aspartate carbamoyltransferase catalytic subunit [Virgibacillus sp. YIM 98842]
MQHFISVDQLTEDELYALFETAESYRFRQIIKPYNQLFAANLFFEPSTRTKMSFIVAEKKLGMEMLDHHNENSSTRKGESLYDTAKTYEAIGADVLVIRDASDDWIEDISDSISIPIINAGAGQKEHPTQCMLDLLTIFQEYGSFDGLKIVIAGDIKHSRVAHSNAAALNRLGAEVYLSAAPGFEDTSLDFPYISMDKAAEMADVIMLLRIQHERHGVSCSMDNYLDQYGLTIERERKMKNEAIILHPAPVNRGVEIDTDLVECERSRIFKQMNNGVYIRMAIITKLLEDRGSTNENTINQCQTAFLSV